MSRRLATSGPFSVWYRHDGCIELQDERDRGDATIGVPREEWGQLMDVVQDVQDKLNHAIVCQHGKRYLEWCDDCRDLKNGPPVWTAVEPE